MQRLHETSLPLFRYFAEASRMKPVAMNGALEPTVQAIRLCREYAIQKLEEVQESDIFVGGMQPFDVDDLMHGAIVTRNGLLECYHPMEFEYYNFNIVASWFNANLCAYCAGASGSDGLIDEDFTPLWKTVFPLCQECRAGEVASLAQTRRRNGANNERRAQRARLETPVIPHLPNEDVASAEATSGVATNNIYSATRDPLAVRHGRRNPPSNGLAHSQRPNARRTR